MEESILELQGIGVHFEDRTILENIEIKINRGEWVGLLGPNGCGKTTLLKVMCGVLKPNQGEVRLAGQPLSHFSRREIARKVSVLPQEANVDFPFTSREIVLMGRSPYLPRFGWETPHDVSVTREAMERTDCLQFADQDVRSLSGGEKERVFLARALAQEPEILLLDEPTTHLDLKHQAETSQLLKDLHREKGFTLVVVLHDLNYALQSCQRVLLLADKKIQADGPPEEILNPDLLQEIYGVKVKQHFFPGKELPYLIPEL